jgi:hypothetical protein
MASEESRDPGRQIMKFAALDPGSSLGRDTQRF